MLLKNFYLKNTLIFDTFNEKKFCNKNIYGKFLIRSKIFKNKNLFFLDNNENFFHIKEKKVYKRLNFPVKKNILGYSFRVKNNLYTNQQNKLIKFNYFSFYKTKINPLSNLNNFFYLLKNKKRISLIFLKAVKGGFLCYFSGVFCFVANYQIYNYIASHIKFLLKLKIFDNLKYFLYLDTNFFYYPWVLSHFKLQINYTKRRKLKTPKRKFYLLQFNMKNYKNLNKKFLYTKKFYKFIDKRK